MKVNRSSRFDTIIAVREYQKKAATRELQKIMNEKQANIDYLNTLKEEQTNAMDGQSRTRTTHAHEVQTHRAFLGKLTDGIQKQQEQLREIETQEETKREELLERVKAQTVVEKLQKKVNEEIQKEQHRKEQQTIDMLSQRGSAQ